MLNHHDTSDIATFQVSRREALKLSAAVLLSSGTTLAKDRSAPAKQGGCTLGFSTYGMKSMKSEQAICVLAEIGYDSVELTVRSGWDADSERLNPQRKTSLRKQIADAPLQLTSLMEHVSPLGNEQQATALKRLKLAAGLAHDLAPNAPPHIQTVLGSGHFQEKKQQLRDRLAEWVKLADSTETMIAVKPHRGGVVSQPAEAIWLLEQLGYPKRLRMVYDYSHYAFRNLPMDKTIKTALPYTCYIAVKDAVKKGKRVVFQLPGESGQIDFAGLIRQFYEGGYRGDINCEVSGMVWGKPQYDPVAAARLCYQNMSRAFELSEVPRKRN